MKKLVISLMIVALAVSAQAGTMTIVDEVSDLNLVGVVAAINAGSRGGTALDDTTDNATTVMEGVTFTNTGVGKDIWDGHNDDLFLYQMQIDNGWAKDGQKFVGPGGSASPIAEYSTLSQLYCSEEYGGDAAGSTLTQSIAVANGTYDVQVLIQVRGSGYAYHAITEQVSIEGQDSDLYDLVAMNASNSLDENIDAASAYFLGGWVYTDTVTVTDGSLDIVVTSAGGNVKYNGIIVTPEPASMVLLGLGGLLLRRRK